MFRSKLYLAFISFLVFIPIILMPLRNNICNSTAEDSDSQGAAYWIKPDIFRAKFNVEGIPALNKEVQLMLTVNPIFDLDNVNIRISLPDTVSLVKGTTQWQGRIGKDQVFKLVNTIKVVDYGLYKGQHQIQANLIYITKKHKDERSVFIYLLTDKEKGEIAYHPEYPYARGG